MWIWRILDILAVIMPNGFCVQYGKLMLCQVTAMVNCAADDNLVMISI